MIETACPGEELPEQRVRAGGEAGSIVLHVGHDINEKETNDEETDDAAAAEKVLESDEVISKEDMEIRRLIEERRTTPKEEKERLKEVSKQFEKMHQEQKRMKRQEEIQRILEDFKSATRRVHITKIRSEKGEVITSRKGIANVFGEFCSKLYDEDQHDETEMQSDKNETEHDEKELTEIPEITTDELPKAIKRLKKGKAADSNGIRAEDIKACDEETKEMVRQIFNEIVKQNEFTPEAW